MGREGREGVHHRSCRPSSPLPALTPRHHQPSLPPTSPPPPPTPPRPQLTNRLSLPAPGPSVPESLALAELLVNQLAAPSESETREALQCAPEAEHLSTDHTLAQPIVCGVPAEALVGYESIPDLLTLLLSPVASRSTGEEEDTAPAFELLGLRHIPQLSSAEARRVVSSCLITHSGAGFRSARLPDNATTKSGAETLITDLVGQPLLLLALRRVQGRKRMKELVASLGAGGEALPGRPPRLLVSKAPKVSAEPRATPRRGTHTHSEW